MVGPANGERRGDVPRSNLTDADKKECVRYYLTEVQRYVERAAAVCAESSRADEFLWHVRRTLECILAAVLEYEGYDATEENGSLCELNKLREYVSKIRREDLSTQPTLQVGFSIIQASGNRGAHAMSFRQSKSDAGKSDPNGQVGATHAGKHLCECVRWVFDVVKQTSRCPNEALKQIEQPGAEPPKSSLSTALPWVVTGCALTALTLVLVWKYLPSRQDPLTTNHTTNDSQPNAEPGTAPTAAAAVRHGLVEDAGPSAPNTVGPEPSESHQPPPACPDAMLAVTLASVRVNPPDRTDAARGAGVAAWREGLRAGETQSFDVCVDLRPVSTRAFSSFLAGIDSQEAQLIRDEQSQNRVCRRRINNPNASQGCVHLREAQAYCKAAHGSTAEFEQGEVPSVAFWEALRDNRPTLLRLAPDQTGVTHANTSTPVTADVYLAEWAGDRGAVSLWRGLRPEFSSYGFWRAPRILDVRTVAIHSWTATQQPPGDRLTDPTDVVRNESIGFRCLVRRRAPSQ